MEKLFKLLNEYDSGWDYDDYYGPYQYGQDRDAYKYGRYYLVSRDYGFIKWLVENDKIDLDMVREKLGIPCRVWYGSGRIIAVKDVEDYRQILMLLSISDTPIEDLLLYLK